MDPLSVSASVIGLITAAAKVTSLLCEFTNNLNDAPTLARHVTSEVQAVNFAICHLQAFLWGDARTSKSREAMVMVEHLVMVLTGCVCTFDELTSLKCTSGDGTKYMNRLKWALKEGTITQLLQRLQDHKSSLNLMLTILQSKSTVQAEKSSEELSMLVTQLQEDQRNMFERLKSLEFPPPRSSLRDTCNRSYSASGPNFQTSMENYGFAFEFDLHKSRVYRRALSRYPTHSTASLTSSVAAKSMGWSYMSGISLADISQISVLSLPIYTFEILNSQNYPLRGAAREDFEVAWDNNISETTSQFKSNRTGRTATDWEIEMDQCTEDIPFEDSDDSGSTIDAESFESLVGEELELLADDSGLDTADVAGVFRLTENGFKVTQPKPDSQGPWYGASDGSRVELTEWHPWPHDLATIVETPDSEGQLIHGISTGSSAYETIIRQNIQRLVRGDCSRTPRLVRGGVELKLYNWDDSEN